MGEQIYTPIWNKALPEILQILLSPPHNGSMQFSPDNFNDVGGRKVYTFRLDIVKGAPSNNLSGSAVARDLADVFLSDERTRALADRTRILLRMDKYFTFHASIVL
jgi:hypothetical protein